MTFQIEYDAGVGWRYLTTETKTRAIELARYWAQQSKARWKYRVINRAGKQVWPEENADDPVRDVR